MLECFIESADADATPVIPLTADELKPWVQGQSPYVKKWVTTNKFTAKVETTCLVPDPEGDIAMVLLGVDNPFDPWVVGALPTKLPAGNYTLQTDWSAAQLGLATQAWGLGCYRFDRYKANNDRAVGKLVMDPSLDAGAIAYQVEAISQVRDLINTPAADMMPQHLAEAAQQLAEKYAATCTLTAGEQLLLDNYPVIHAVGRASDHAPQLIDVQWGDAGHPRITLVGKGVCFDTGGLDIKPAVGMRYMKKDMGGAAHVLGLARMIMAQQLPVNLRVLIPAVDNAISGDAFRPGDIVTSRKGTSIEIDNTDAEGRLVLCDALTEAADKKPELIIDFATLTGAARVALGTEVPALFCNSDTVSRGIIESAEHVYDPLWRMPLHKPYCYMLNSQIADIKNAATDPFGGSITAALFLQEFVPADIEWVHIDVMAWNARNRAGRPKGGEAMGVSAMFDYLSKRYAH